MRKEVQFKVKQDLKECTPEASILSKDEIPDELKLAGGSNSSNIVACNDDIKITIKQEVDDVEHWKEHNTVNKDLDSVPDIKEEIKDIESSDCVSDEIGEIKPVKVEEGLQNNGNPNLSSIESTDVCNIGDISKAGVVFSPHDIKTPDQFVSNENNTSNDQVNVSDDMPVNLTVVKDYYAGEITGYRKTGKRKRSSCCASSEIKNKSNSSISVRGDKKLMNCTDKMFSSMMYNSGFYENLPYSQILKPVQAESSSWGQSSTLQSSSGTYVRPNINESSVVDSHLHCSHSDQSINEKIENRYTSSIQNSNSFMIYDTVSSTLKDNCTEKSSDILQVSKSPIPVLYSDIPIHPSEITNKNILRCTCDKCLSISPTELIQGCKYLQQMSENLSNSGEELIRRIEESLAETETLKSKEVELLKKILKSLDEAESLKFKEGEILKKIEKSLTEAETLKSREEEILRKIEVSLSKSETSRSQDGEISIKIENYLQKEQYSVLDEDTESEKKYNIDLDVTLPLKKRKKWLKTSQKEEVKPKAQKVESFPSYPSRPMISIAELLQKNIPLYENFSTAPISQFPSKFSYFNSVNVDPKNVDMFDRDNNMDSKVFGFYKSEGTSSCSYSGMANTFIATSTADDLMLVDRIKREIRSPILTDEGVVNLSINEDKVIGNNKKTCKLEMNFPVMNKEEKEVVNVNQEVDKGDINPFPNKDPISKNSLPAGEMELGIKSEIKEEICPVDCNFIKKENISD